MRGCTFGSLRRVNRLQGSIIHRRPLWLAKILITIFFLTPETPSLTTSCFQQRTWKFGQKTTDSHHSVAIVALYWKHVIPDHSRVLTWNSDDLNPHSQNLTTYNRNTQIGMKMSQKIIQSMVQILVTSVPNIIGGTCYVQFQ